MAGGFGNGTKNARKWTRMSNRDLMRMGFGNLLRRKTRTILTVLGVIIGTCSIVVMLSLGIAMDRGFQEQLAYMGDLTLIEVYDHGQMEMGRSTRGSQGNGLDDQEVDRFWEIPGVKAVMPVRSLYMKMGAGRYVSHVNVVGIDPLVMEAFGFNVAEGRLLLESDRDAVIFGGQVAYQFYNPRAGTRHVHYGMATEQPPPVDVMTANLVMTTDPMYGESRHQTLPDAEGAPPRIYDVRSVGILESNHSEMDYTVYMNRSSLERIMGEEQRTTRQDRGRANQQNYDRVRVKVESLENVEQVQAIIQAMGYQTFSLTDMLNSMKDASRMIQAILGGIGAVSLLVAAIGITNTMIMSIYERTREIGVMKVIGARLTDIRKLFLIEAGLIGFLGGLLGIGFSFTISMGLNRVGAGFMGPGVSSGISVIPLKLAAGSLLFSTFIGVISGYSPARRAMKLSALEAIRND